MNITVLLGSFKDFNLSYCLRHDREFSRRSSGTDLDDDPTVIATFADFYQFICECSKAENLYQRALLRIAKKLGPKHLDTLRRMVDLAEMCFWNHKYDMAEDLYKRWLAIREETLTREDPDVWNITAMLSATKICVGQYDDAVALDRELGMSESQIGKRLIAYSGDCVRQPGDVGYP